MTGLDSAKERPELGSDWVAGPSAMTGRPPARVVPEIMRHSEPKLSNHTCLDAWRLPTAAAIDSLGAFEPSGEYTHTIWLQR